MIKYFKHIYIELWLKRTIEGVRSVRIFEKACNY